MWKSKLSKAVGILLWALRPVWEIAKWYADKEPALLLLFKAGGVMSNLIHLLEAWWMSYILVSCGAGLIFWPQVKQAWILKFRRRLIILQKTERLYSPTYGLLLQKPEDVVLVVAVENKEQEKEIQSVRVYAEVYTQSGNDTQCVALGYLLESTSQKDVVNIPAGHTVYFDIAKSHTSQLITELLLVGNQGMRSLQQGLAYSATIKVMAKGYPTHSRPAIIGRMKGSAHPILELGRNLSARERRKNERESDKISKRRIREGKVEGIPAAPQRNWRFWRSRGNSQQND